MDAKEIRYRFTDTGKWLARCNHDTGLIELNRNEFSKLSLLYQDYLWVHEHVHLLMDVRDEAECDRISADVFLMRATTLEDFRERQDFVKKSDPSATLEMPVEARKRSDKKTPAIAVFVALALMLCFMKN